MELNDIFNEISPFSSSPKITLNFPPTSFPHLAVLRATGHKAGARVALVVAGHMAGPGGDRVIAQRGESYTKICGNPVKPHG